MTPEQITGLAALLIELRDWVYDNDPGSLDGDMIDATIAALARIRRQLVEDGAL